MPRYRQAETIQCRPAPHGRRSSRRRRYAFTLIELLAATVLATLLTLAVFAILPAIGPARAIARTDALSQDTLRLLRCDLVNSRRFQPGPNGVTLWGFAALNPDSLSQTQRSVKVTYRIAPVGEASCLVRSQSEMDASTPDEGSSEVVASNVAAFAVDGLPDSENELGLGPVRPATRPSTRPAARGQFDRGVGRPLPRRVEVRIRGLRGGEIRRVICLR